MLAVTWSVGKATADDDDAAAADDDDDSVDGASVNASQSYIRNRY